MLNSGRIYRIQPVGSTRELVGQLISKDLPLCRGFYYLGLLYLNDSSAVAGERKFAVMKVERFPVPGRHEVDQVKILSLSGSTETVLSKAIDDLQHAEPLSRAIVRIDDESHSCPLCA